MELLVYYTILLFITLKIVKIVCKIFVCVFGIGILLLTLIKYFKNYFFLKGSEDTLESKIFRFAVNYIPPLRNKLRNDVKKADDDFYKDMTKYFEH